MFGLKSKVVWRSAAIVGGCVSLVFLAWVLMSNRDDNGTRRADAQGCAYIDGLARTFVADKLPAILSAAHKDELADPQEIEMLSIDASFIRDGARKCRSLDGRALGTRTPLAEYFRPHDELFSPLEDFLREWRFTPLKDMRDVEPRLARLEALEHTLPSAALAATASTPHP